MHTREGKCLRALEVRVRDLGIALIGDKNGTSRSDSFGAA
jgi:hypothetical protein